MSTEQQENGSTVETTGQESQENQQQAPGTETGKGEQQQAPTITDETRLPDTHPLVKAYRAQLEENRKHSATKTELAEANARAERVTKLETELAARPTTEAMASLQNRYDRLEAFLQEVGGPVGKALDSRTFTRDLFESDKDIADLVKDWHRANPSATSTALGSAAAAPKEKAPSMSDVLRAAIK